MQDEELDAALTADPETDAAAALTLSDQSAPLTAAQDGLAAFYASLPQPSIRDSAFPGPPPPPPLPAPVPRPPLPDVHPNPIVRAIALAAMGILGPQRGGAGLGRGILESEALQRQDALQQYQLKERRAEQLDVLQERAFRDKIAQHRADTAAWTAAATQQQREIQSITGQLSTALASGKLSEDQANAMIDQAGDRLTSLGVRGFTANDLRRKGYHHTGPDEQVSALEAVKRLAQFNGNTLEGIDPGADIIVGKRKMSVLEAVTKAGQGGLFDANTGTFPGRPLPKRPLPIGEEADIDRAGQTAWAKAKAEGLTDEAAGEARDAAADARRKVIEGIKAKARQEAKPSDAATGGPSLLTDEGLALAAAQYRITGRLPQLGMGRTPDRARIINQAAADAKMLGQAPAVAIQKQAAFKADASALQQMQRLSAGAEASESKAIGQIDIIKAASKGVPRTQLPFLNRAIQAWRVEGAGDPAATQLANAILTFSQEYGKIIEGSTASVQGATDAARRAAGRLVSAAMNPRQLESVLDLMQREMDLTVNGYGVSISHITERMGGTPGETKAPPALVPTKRFNPTTGRIEDIK